MTAKNAEIDCIGCLWGFRDKTTLKLAGANYVINSPEEIIDFINKINK